MKMSVFSPAHVMDNARGLVFAGRIILESVVQELLYILFDLGLPVPAPDVNSAPIAMDPRIALPVDRGNNNQRNTMLPM